jgi:hypothetical protein
MERRLTADCLAAGVVVVVPLVGPHARVLLLLDGDLHVVVVALLLVVLLAVLLGNLKAELGLFRAMTLDVGK